MMRTVAVVFTVICLLPLAAADTPTATVDVARGGNDAEQVAGLPPALQSAAVTAAEATALPPAYLAAVLQQPPAATSGTPPATVQHLARRLLDSGQLPGGGWDAEQALTGLGYRATEVSEALTRAAIKGYRYSPHGPPKDPQRYVFPVAGPVRFGSEHHDYPATDIFADIGAPIVAVVRSEVLSVSPRERGKGGITTTLRGEDGWRYYYAHLAAVHPRLRVGDVVERGTVIGTSGNTGNARSTPPHLHFGISRAGSVAGEIPPYPYLTIWPRATVSVRSF